MQPERGEVEQLFVLVDAVVSADAFLSIFLSTLDLIIRKSRLKKVYCTREKETSA